MIHDSLFYQDFSMTILDWVELRIQLNQFEMFVSSLKHEKNIENCTVIGDKSVKISPCKYLK